MNQCCICCPVLNASKYLDNVLCNMIKIGKSVFDDYKIVLYYENSQDNTIDIILKYLGDKKITLIMNETYKNKREKSHNLAHARNKLMEYVRNNCSNMEYMIMMDANEMTSSIANPQILKNHLENKDWDSLTFTWKGEYQDIWSLSMRHLALSVWKASQPATFQIYADDIREKIQMCKPGELIGVFSAFNGLCIYRLKLFIDSYYDGLPRNDLLPPFLIGNTKAIIGKEHPYYWKREGENEQDSEHRAFHHHAKFVHNAKIRISPISLFT